MRKTSLWLAIICTLTVALAAAGPGVALGDSGGHGNGRGNGIGWGFGHFRDVEEEFWAYHDIALMEVKDVLGGYGDGSFGPQDPVTRIQLVVLALRVMGLADQAEEMGTDAADAVLKAAFADADSVPTWEGARECLAYAFEQGFLYGLTYEEQNRFRADDPATRLEVIVTLIEAMGRHDDAAALGAAPIDAPDASTVPEWAHGYVALALEIGLLRGDETGALNLSDSVRRAEIAALLARVDGDVQSDIDDKVIEGVVVAVTTGASPSITITTESSEIQNYSGENGATDQGAGTQPGGDSILTVTYPVSPDAQIFLHDRPATLADLSAGDEVEISLADGVAILIDADSGNDHEREGRDKVSGTVVSAVYTGDVLTSLTITPTGNNDEASQPAQDVTYDVSPDVVILLDGEKTDAQPAAGDSVKLRLMDGKVVVVDIKEGQAEALRGEFEGTFVAVGPGPGTGSGSASDQLFLTFTVTAVLEPGGQEESSGSASGLSVGANATLPLAADVEVLSGHDVIALDQLKAGDTIRVKVEDGQVVRIRVGASGEGNGGG